MAATRFQQDTHYDGKLVEKSLEYLRTIHQGQFAEFHSAMELQVPKAFPVVWVGH